MFNLIKKYKEYKAKKENYFDTMDACLYEAAIYAHKLKFGLDTGMLRIVYMGKDGTMSSPFNRELEDLERLVYNVKIADMFRCKYKNM